MPVLITGGAGYIGSQTVLELIGAGETVVVLDDLSTGFEAAVPADAKLVVGDTGDVTLVAQLIAQHAIDAIIHFAGSVVVPESVAKPLDYYDNNTGKTRRLLAAAVAARVPHFVFSSTAAVYGNAGFEAVKEDHSLQPQSPYGRSKLTAEWMLEDVARAHPLKYSILRYFNVAGADPLGRAGQATRGATHLIKVACEAATARRKFVEVFGTDYPTADGTCIRDYIHVKDLAVAHRLALERLRTGGSSLIANCGYGRGYSVLEVLRAVQRISGNPFEIRLSGRRPGDPAVIVANAELARTELGWFPEFDNLEAMIGSALSWEKAPRY